MPLTLTDLRLDSAGEPRVLDLDVAERLGFDRPNKVRDLIDRNTDELRRYGDLVEVDGVVRNLPRGGVNSRGRPGRAFLLNHDQAMIVAVLSRAPRAADVRQQLVAVYNAYRSTQAPQLAVFGEVARLGDEVSALRTRQLITDLKIERQADQLAALAGDRLSRLKFADAEDVRRFIGCCTEPAPGETVEQLTLFVLWERWRVKGGGRQFTPDRFMRLCIFNGLKPDHDRKGSLIHDLRLTVASPDVGGVA